MNALFKLSVVALPLVLLSSCATTMYTTNAVNAPLLKEKGEVKINVTQNDLQAAVAVSDKIGIMANGYYENFDGSNNYKHGGAMGELGIGYLLNSEGNLMMESYVGAGLGKVHKQEQFSNTTNDTYYMASFDVNAVKGFLQTNLGYRSKYFDVALTPKFSFVKYSNFSQTNYSNEQLEKDYLGNRLTDPLFVFAEPAITVRGGYKFVKIQAQYGVTLNVGGQNIRKTPDFASLGLVIDIAKWYKD